MKTKMKHSWCQKAFFCHVVFQDNWTKEVNVWESAHVVTLYYAENSKHSMLTNYEWLIQPAQHADKLWVAHTASTACWQTVSSSYNQHSKLTTVSGSYSQHNMLTNCEWLIQPTQHADKLQVAHTANTACWQTVSAHTASTACWQTVSGSYSQHSMLTNCEWLIQSAQHADKLWVAHTARTACWWTVSGLHGQYSKLTNCEWLTQPAQHADKLWVAHTASTACWQTEWLTWPAQGAGSNTNCLRSQPVSRHH
jgi:hypothetical protein